MLVPRRKMESPPQPGNESEREASYAALADEWFEESRNPLGAAPGPLGWAARSTSWCARTRSAWEP